MFAFFEFACLAFVIITTAAPSVAARDLRPVKAVLEKMGYSDDTKPISNKTTSSFGFKLARYATPDEDATPEEEVVRLSAWGLLREFLHDNAARFDYRPRP